ncbi:hypothetical protein D3C81_795910 [compost metagenome]
MPETKFILSPCTGYKIKDKEDKNMMNSNVDLLTLIFGAYFPIAAPHMKRKS